MIRRAIVESLRTVGGVALLAAVWWKVRRPDKRAARRYGR